MLLGALVFMLLNTADLMLTRRLLGAGCVEVGPILGPVLYSHGWLAMCAVKMALVMLITSCVLLAKADRVLRYMNAGMTLVCLYLGVLIYLLLK